MKIFRQKNDGATLKEYVAFILMLFSLICGMLVYRAYGQTKDSPITRAEFAQAFSVTKETSALDATYLDLSGKELSEIPDSVFEMHSLEVLNLDNNNLTMIPPDIRKLQNLRILIIGRNDVYELPEEINHLVMLKEVHLSYERWQYKINDLKKITHAKIVLL